MTFFRSEDGYASLSTDDALEIFYDVLKGSSDLSLDAVRELFSRYGLEDEGNLIAAAPELLSELKLIVDVVSLAHRSHIERAWAVIAKAEGR